MPPPSGYTIPATAIPAGPPGTVIPRAEGPAPAGGTELLLPQSSPPGKIRSDYPEPRGSRGGAILGEPDVAYPPPTTDVGDLSEDKPAPANKSEAVNRITDLTPVKDGVSAGRRPDLDGLDWLKANGHKAVVSSHQRRGRFHGSATGREKAHLP